MSKLAHKIESLIEPIIIGMGYVLWGCELHSSGKYTLLRVYIDVAETRDERGVDLDDCSKVSDQISAILDVEDVIAGSYNLEVSSPGMDRSLFKLEHFKRYIGSSVHLKLSQAIDGRRNFTGCIQGVGDDKVSLLIDNKIFEIPFAFIAKANLVPNFSR